MKREFLEKLGFEKEMVDQIIGGHGKGVESRKAQLDAAKGEGWHPMRRGGIFGIL